jgi:hypothetical protein
VATHASDAHRDWRRSSRHRGARRDDGFRNLVRMESVAGRPKRILAVFIAGFAIAGILGGVANAANFGEGLTSILGGAAIAIIAALGVPWVMGWNRPEPRREPKVHDGRTTPAPRAPEDWELAVERPMRVMLTPKSGLVNTLLRESLPTAQLETRNEAAEWSTLTAVYLRTAGSVNDYSVSAPREALEPVSRHPQVALADHRAADVEERQAQLGKALLVGFARSDETVINAASEPAESTLAHV